MFSEYVQQDNAGYVHRLMLVKDSDASVAYGAVTVAEDAEVLEVFFADKQASWSMDTGMTTNGVQYVYDVTAKVPKNKTENVDWQLLNMQKRWIVLLQDANELVHIIGNEGDGCQLKIGGKIDGMNAVNMSLTWQGGEPEMMTDVELDSLAAVGIIAGDMETQNISVSGLSDGGTVPHGLNTLKVAALFYDNSNRQVKEIDFEPLTTGSIKVYLPVLDSGTASFSGEVFLIKRI